MRVISLVPSLTETLLYCGVSVVGRTRFCIHPADIVRHIPVVGGTKEVNWDKCLALKPDLVILDREENTREMADACPFDWVATHVTSVNNVGTELRRLAEKLESNPLSELADGWDNFSGSLPLSTPSLDAIPGTMKTIGKPDHCTRLEYLIWRDPWMTIGGKTFIASMLTRVGLGQLMEHHEVSYPEVNDPLPRADTYYLLSSEPYPFERHIDELEAEGFNGALVDGEFYSWFGIRSFNALKAYLQK